MLNRCHLVDSKDAEINLKVCKICIANFCGLKGFLSVHLSTYKILMIFAVACLDVR